MRNKGIILIIFLILPLNKGLVRSQDIEKYYVIGQELYSSGDYQGAVDEWEKLAGSGYNSPGLFYNMGNAYFKTGNIPASILYYEKALLIKPFDEDTRYNLEIARSYLVDNFEVIPELFFLL